MPELPEVETIVRDLRPALVGRRIGRVTLSHDDVLRGVTRRRLVRRLTGATIRQVSRRAKHAVLELDSGRLVIQPGMTGSLMIYRRALTPDDARYAVLRARLDDGRELVYRDVRRLGTLLFLNEKGWERYSSMLGPEPLDPDFSAERLGAALLRSRQAVKKVIMDQRHLAGVGNIYAN
jgi:formamidopyrimidine-DNA glycosylase